MLTEFNELPPVYDEQAPIGRSWCQLKNRPLVLFHKNGNALRPKFQKKWYRTLEQLGCGPVVELEQPDWNWCHGPESNFNCHAFAIGSSVGLTPNDWVEGMASPLTLHANPADLLLRSFFIPTTTIDRTDRSGYESGKESIDNDVFVIHDSRFNHLRHSGFIKWVDGQPMAVSKFGEGPILITTLKLLWSFFDGKFDQLRWFRLRHGN